MTAATSSSKTTPIVFTLSDGTRVTDEEVVAAHLEIAKKRLKAIGHNKYITQFKNGVMGEQTIGVYDDVIGDYCYQYQHQAVVFGHTHLADLRVLSNGAVVANSGTWMSSPKGGDYRETPTVISVKLSIEKEKQQRFSEPESLSISTVAAETAASEHKNTVITLLCLNETTGRLEPMVSHTTAGRAPTTGIGTCSTSCRGQEDADDDGSAPKRKRRRVAMMVLVSAVVVAAAAVTVSVKLLRWKGRSS